MGAEPLMVMKQKGRYRILGINRSRDGNDNETEGQTQDTRDK